VQDLRKQSQGFGSWKGNSRVLWKANDLCQRLARGGLNLRNPFGKLFLQLDVCARFFSQMLFGSKPFW